MNMIVLDSTVQYNLCSTVIHCLTWHPRYPRQLSGAVRGGAGHRLSRGSSHWCHRFHFHASLGGNGGLVRQSCGWMVTVDVRRG